LYTRFALLPWLEPSSIGPQRFALRISTSKRKCGFNEGMISVLAQGGFEGKSLETMYLAAFPKSWTYVLRSHPKEQARTILRKAMIRAGIPPRSTTARCMFEPTKMKFGETKCKFGPTPLWDNRLKVTGGKVLKTEFLGKSLSL
jgi:hypothetical protein